MIFEELSCVYQEPVCEIFNQKPHADALIIKERMTSTELQNILRALETELDITEANIEPVLKVEAPIVTVGLSANREPRRALVQTARVKQEPISVKEEPVDIEAKPETVTKPECEISRTVLLYGRSKVESENELVPKPELPECCNVKKEIDLPVANIKQETEEKLCPFADTVSLAENSATDKTRRPQYSCGVCHQNFTTTKGLNKHNLRRHTKKTYKTRFRDGHFYCKICSHYFAVKIDLIKHLLVHVGEKPVSCKRCQREFPTKYRLKKHMISHSHSTDFKIACKICLRLLKDKETLAHHLIRHEKELKPHCCNACNERFEEAIDLTIHKRLHTNAPKSYTRLKKNISPTDRMTP